MKRDTKLVLRGVAYGGIGALILMGLGYVGFPSLGPGAQKPVGPPDTDRDGIIDVFDNCPDVADSLNDPRKCQDDFIETTSIVESKSKKVFSAKGLQIKTNTIDGKTTAFPAYKLIVRSKKNQNRPGQYIIRQRCDNINMELTCKGHSISKRDVFYPPIGISCPNPGNRFIDVIRPIQSSSNEVQCNLANHFVLSADELGIGNGESIACTVTGTYRTEGIVDPDASYSIQPGDENVSCLNGNGRVVLTPVNQNISPQQVIFTASAP